MSEAIARIGSKLAQLRADDTAYRIFAAQSHHYRLGPGLSEEELQGFEHTHGITLPADYRAFLQQVGNGGAGPYYGLAALPTDDTPNLPGLKDPALAKPFPLTAALNLLVACTGSDDLDAYFARCEEDEDYAEQVSACMAQYSEPAYDQGTLRLAEYGCGICFFLVVSGPEAGHVWVDDRADDAGLFPLTPMHDPQGRVSFVAWYENWLDHSLAQVWDGHDYGAGTYFEFGYTLQESLAARAEAAPD